jgi:hypothetical protein
MSPASTHTTDQAGTRSKHKTLSVLPGWPTATPTSVRIQCLNWPHRAPGRAEPVIHTQRRLGRLSQDAELQREELLQEHGGVA